MGGAASVPGVLVDGLRFPECPRWRDGVLWFSDLYGPTVHTVDPDGRLATVCEVPARPHGLGFLPDGTLLVVSSQDRRLLRLDPDGLHEVADLTELTGGDANDMVVDARGRAYIGNFGFDIFGGAPIASTTLVLVTPDGDARVVADDLIFPNGCVLTPDGRTLVVAETYESRLTAFDVAADGSLSGRRVFAQLSGMTPDGICLDADGALWVASPFSNAFLRVADGGEVLDRIETSGRMAVACMLGGDDGHTLFLCIAQGSIDEMIRGETRGCIETARVGVPHAGLP